MSDFYNIYGNLHGEKQKKDSEEEKNKRLKEEKERADKKRRAMIGAVFSAIVVICITILLSMSLKKVKPGYVGVVYNMNGGVQEKTLGQGWHWINPSQRLTQYSIGIEQSYLTATKDGDSPNDDSFSAPSKDGKGLTMELTFTYRFDENRVAEVFTRQKGRSGSEVLSTFIKPNIISWTKEVTATYPVAEILGEKRAELNTAVSDYLAKRFEPYGIIIENVSLINISTDEETQTAIARKVNAQQERDLAIIEADKTKINADKEKIVVIFITILLSKLLLLMLKKRKRQL